ncbi:MAG: CDP-alcohol phosphatidyltransferase family protein [Deltaproteobacteria bacterium]|nr:CDP-alcohol phosphatidyltransferase family protein [Deltaproteobacteria bacterium]
MKSHFVIYIPKETHESTAVSFTRVAGIPLFLRSILSLAKAGEQAFTIIAPASHRKQFIKNCQKLIKTRPIHLNFIFANQHDKISDANIKELKECAEENVYFLNANYVFTDPKRISPVKQAGRNEICLYRSQTRRTALIGMHSSMLDELKQSETIEQFLANLIDAKTHHYLSDDDEGIVAQKFMDIPLAERMLTEHIRKNTNKWVAREINKRISLPISLGLMRLRITPNTITAINAFIGLCAGIGAAGKTYTGVLIGAILFQAASVFDGCDGEVAKLTFRTSKFGEYIDTVSDNLTLAAFLIGMMIHQRRITHSGDAYWWGAFLILGAALILLIMTDYLRKHCNSASFFTFDKEYLQHLSPANAPKWILAIVKIFKPLFRKDAYALMFLMFAVFGILHWWFYFITIGVWAAVMILFYLIYLRGQKT